MTDIDMAAEVQRYLDKLGTTAEEIRTSLADLGVKGRIKFAPACPLARYLQDAIPGPAFRVYGTYLQWWVRQDPRPGAEVLDLSNALITFVYNFDTEQYPELIDYPR